MTVYNHYLSLYIAHQLVVVRYLIPGGSYPILFGCLIFCTSAAISARKSLRLRKSKYLEIKENNSSMFGVRL